MECDIVEATRGSYGLSRIAEGSPGPRLLASIVASRNVDKWAANCAAKGEIINVLGRCYNA